MSRPSVGSSSTSSFASMAITSARCSCATIPFDSSRTLLLRRMSVFARSSSPFARRNCGRAPATKSSGCETRSQRGSTATSAMKQTSRIRSSRLVQGSSPSTCNSPSYEVRPRMALRAVVLPAPFGPMRPRMRPSSTCRSRPSSATVGPNDLRRPRASIAAIASALLRRFGRRGEQLLRAESQALDGGPDVRPLLFEEVLPLAGQQQLARAGVDEHAAAALHLHELLVHQLLVSLEDRDRVDPVLRGDVAHGRQRVAFAERSFQDEGDDAVAELAVDGLAVVPLAFHSACSDRLGDVVNYNT